MLPPIVEDYTAVKAALTASLSTDAQANGYPNPSHREVTDFFSTLLSMLDACTESLVKRNSEFILRFILPHPSRALAFTQYLCTTARYCSPGGVLDEPGLNKSQPPLPIDRRHHAFLLISNVLGIVILRIRNNPRHNSVYHVDDSSLDYLKHALRRMGRLAVCSDGMPSQPSARIYDSIMNRVDCYERKKMLSRSDAAEWKAKLESARAQSFADLLSDMAKDEAQMAQDSQQRHADSPQWTVPERHTLPGDPNPPWHELPAGNGLHLRRIARQRGAFKSGALPSGGFMLLNRGRKASVAVQKDVQDMLEEAKRCFDTYTNFSEVEDIDALGNLIWRKETGRRRRTHYGHSYENIEAKRGQQRQRSEHTY